MSKKKKKITGKPLCKGERSSDETAEDSKTVNKKKTAFKRKYQESYLNYGFISTGDSHSPSLLCIACGNWLHNKAMKHSKLLCLLETKYPALRQVLRIFQKNKMWTKRTGTITEGHHFFKCVCTESIILNGLSWYFLLNAVFFLLTVLEASAVSSLDLPLLQRGFPVIFFFFFTCFLLKLRSPLL